MVKIFFKSDFDKAAALLDALIQSHGFSDGNKRTSIGVTEYFLEMCNHKLTLSDNDVYVLLHDIEAHRYSIESLSKYLSSHSKHI